MAALEILNVQKNYGAVSVLKGISLTVEPGEFTVLLGPSGCGKSTLLHALAGLEDIDAGTLRIGGVDVTDLEPKDRGIAMVFQSYALYPTMTVAENLSFGLRMSQVGAAEIASRIHEAARMLQIENLLDRKPAQLSGGQRQRVAIGRAIVRKVPVFLFDEPLSNLDAKLRTDMRVELKRLHAELGTTMVYVTHDQVEAMTMATRIAVLNGGLVEQYDTPQVLYDSPANMFVAGFVGTPPMNFLKGVMSTVECRAVVAIGDRMIDVSHYHCKARPNDGEAVFLGIRPEHLSITEPEIASAVPGDLISIEPLGSETLAWIATCDARLCVRLSPDRGGQIPSRMGLAISPSKISLFAATSGERI